VVKSTKTRPGNSHLKGALGIAAMAASRSRDTYLAARYRRIASRRGPPKAVVAIERTMLTTIWFMANTGALYDDPGPDFYIRLRPDRAKQRAIKQLTSMGYRVTLDEAG
jgi:transposase